MKIDCAMYNVDIDNSSPGMMINREEISSYCSFLRGLENVTNHYQDEGLKTVSILKKMYTH